MDTTLTSLPSEAGAILLANMSIVEIVSMFSIGAYNALETAIVTFDVFERYRGLYFWSMQAASWGIVLHSIAAMVRFVSQASGLAMSIPFLIGWCAMVTGQALVLYSRLHLVVLNIYQVRWALWMILINAVVLHIPMSILFLGVGQGDPRFVRAANVYDRIQVTGFCIQDLVLCGIYVRQAARIMKPILAFRDRAERRVIIHLLVVNIVVLVLNLLLLIVEYQFHYVQISFKTVVYSIKLKLEFTVLNRLRLLIKRHPYAGRIARSLVCQDGSFDPTSSHANLTGMADGPPPLLDVAIPTSSLWSDISHSSREVLLDMAPAKTRPKEKTVVDSESEGARWIRGQAGRFTEDL